MRPEVDPSANVRRMHNTPIGPTGAAMEKPMISPRKKNPRSIYFLYGKIDKYRSYILQHNLLSSNNQITISKQFPMTKIPISKQKNVSWIQFRFGYWNLFNYWCMVLEISDKYRGFKNGDG